MRVACLGDPLPRVGAQNIVELCEELACMQRSLLEVAEAIPGQFLCFHNLNICVLRRKMRQILFGDS